jgi:hypothetical protein
MFVDMDAVKKMVKELVDMIDEAVETLIANSPVSQDDKRYKAT